jgi:hypothetical protein
MGILRYRRKKDSSMQCKMSSFKTTMCIDRKGSLRQVFIRVYRLEIRLVMLVFSTQLYVAPLTFSLVHLSPPSLYNCTIVHVHILYSV